MGIPGAHQSLRSIVLERDGWVCQLQLAGCTGVATEADHVVERARGGHSTLDNYRAACRHCNASSGGRLGNALKRRRRRHPFFNA